MGYIPALQAVDWMKKCRNRHKPFKPIDHGKLRETRILSGLNKKEAAEMLHVTYRTWHNWESGRVQVPYAAYKLLRILTGLTFQESPGGAGVYPWYISKREKLHSERFRLFIAHFSNGQTMAA